jgi:hypothetical protein
MKKYIILISLISAIFISCKKTNEGNAGSGIPGKQVRLPHGDPVGEATTIRIGSQGGELISNDGRMKISIPSGAVTETTLFSVQEVENVLESQARSYRLLPEDVSFQKPVTLTYYYGGLEIGGMHPDFLFLAFQDSEGYFFSANKTQGNRQQQTLTVTTTHFSDWTFFSEYELYFPDDHTLTEGELQLKVKEEAKIALLSRKVNQKVDESELPEVIADPIVHSATWDYSPKKGTMTRTPDFSQGVTYTAPDYVNGIERTYINATINGKLGTDNRGNIVQQMQFILPVVITNDDYFILSESGTETIASDFSVIYIPGMGCQATASFFSGYTLNFYTYGGGIGGFEYGWGGELGKATMELSELGGNSFISLRPRDCNGGGGEPIFSPGKVVLKSVANAVGQYFEGEFSATLYFFDFCEKPTPKQLSGKFRLRRRI